MRWRGDGLSAKPGQRSSSSQRFDGQIREVTVCEDGTRVATVRLIGVAVIWAPWLLYGETLTLQQAIVAAEANNQVIRAARLEHDKALREIGVARTYRLPIFSVSAL